MSSRERHDLSRKFIEELEGDHDTEVILISDDSEDEVQVSDANSDARDTGSAAPKNNLYDHDMVPIGITATKDDQRFKRLQADFENLNKRSERERRDYTERATMTLVSRLLPVLDNFERALAISSEPTDGEPMRDGVVLIFKQLLEELRREGLEVIEAVGQSFDPEIHEAVETDTTSGKASNIVTEEFLRGYRLKGDLLRPALVKVSIDPTDDVDHGAWNED